MIYHLGRDKPKIIICNNSNFFLCHHTKTYSSFDQSPLQNQWLRNIKTIRYVPTWAFRIVQAIKFSELAICHTSWGVKAQPPSTWLYGSLQCVGSDFLARTGSTVVPDVCNCISVLVISLSLQL